MTATTTTRRRWSGWLRSHVGEHTTTSAGQLLTRRRQPDGTVDVWLETRTDTPTGVVSSTHHRTFQAPAPDHDGHPILDSPCTSTGGHDWRLTEDGYTRWWTTQIDGAMITASFDGSGDFSDTGDGEYLECQNCGCSTDVPEGMEVDFR